MYYNYRIGGHSDLKWELHFEFFLIEITTVYCFSLLILEIFLIMLWNLEIPFCYQINKGSDCWIECTYIKQCAFFHFWYLKKPIFQTIFSRRDHFGPVPLVPFCAMRDSICLIPVVCKKQASQALNQELLLWYGLALYEFNYEISSFSIPIVNTLTPWLTLLLIMGKIIC